MNNFKIYIEVVFVLFFAKSSLADSVKEVEAPFSPKYENKLFKGLSKQKSELPENKAIFLYTPNVSLNCKTSEYAVKVQWLYHDIDGSYMIRTITDNGEVRMPETYALNMSYPGQNSLIILNATMKTAGTYNCLVSYSTMDVKSFSSEINIVTVSKSTGSVIAPFMYFDWKVLYNGRMTPFIKCSNGRVLKGIKKNNTLPYLLFSSCFKPEYLPKYCDIFFKDKFKKLTRFKRYKLEIIKNAFNNFKPLRIYVNKIIAVKEPKDLIISFNRTLSLEMLCEILPPPSEIIWTFMDIEEKCYHFDNSPDVISRIQKTSMHYKIFNKNRYSSRINFFNLDYSAVGQVRCLAVYVNQTVSYKTLSAEIVIVTKLSSFIEMNILREVSEGKEVMVKFIIYYSGNLKPIIVCANSEFSPKDIRKENYNYRVSKHLIFI